MARKKKNTKKIAIRIIVASIILFVLVNAIFFGIRHDTLEPYPDGTQGTYFADIEQIGHTQASYLESRSHNPASPIVVTNKECTLLFEFHYASLIRDPASEYYVPDEPQIIFKLYQSTAQFEAVQDFLAFSNETEEIGTRVIPHYEIREFATKTNGYFLTEFETTWETSFELGTDYLYGFFVEIIDSLGEEITYENNPNCASFFMLFSDKDFKLYVDEVIYPMSPLVIIMPITTAILVTIIGVLVYIVIRKKR